MGSIPLPALAIHGQQQDPTEQMGRLMQLKQMLQNAPLERQAMQQKVQAGGLANQETQYQMGARQAVNEAYKGAVKIDDSGKPTFDSDALSKQLSDAGYGSEVPGILQHLTAYEKARADAAEAQNKIQITSKDAMGYVGRAIQQAKYDPQLAQTIIEHSLADPTIQPQSKQQLLQMRQAISQNPEVIKQFADGAVAQSPEQQKMQTDREVATIRASKPPEGELPLGPDRVAQLNQGLAQRWSVLNPKMPLPAPYTVPQNATQKDYDRIDKLLEATEKAKGTKAQLDTANAMREQTQQMAAQNQQDRQDKEGIQPVTGTDPKTGQDVLVPSADAKKMGLTGVMKADADLVNKSTAARHWLQLADKRVPDNSAPSEMGIMQLIDKMDAEGKLGAVASRWNEFLTGKVGAGDPEFAALRAKMGLSSTKLMQAHVGSRGGAFLMEHFEDLANAKKMDGPTLKAGFQSELNYMKDVAMMPNKAGASQNAQPQGGGAQPAKQLTDVNMARQYLQKAGGDKAKARQLAQQDGWTF